MGSFRLKCFYFTICLTFCLSCSKSGTRNLLEYNIDPQNTYLSGKIIGLYKANAFNDRDFVYALSIDSSSKLLAYPQMVLQYFNLSLADIYEDKIKWSKQLNYNEFDVATVYIANSIKTKLDRPSVFVAGDKKENSNHYNIKRFALRDG